MSEPTLAFDRAETRKAISALMSAWLKRWDRPCEWCGVVLTADVLDEWVEWCLQLGELLEPTRKGLPAARVFCRDCAMGAREELLTGRKYVPSCEDEAVPF